MATEDEELKEIWTLLGVYVLILVVSLLFYTQAWQDRGANRNLPTCKETP